MNQENSDAIQTTRTKEEIDKDYSRWVMMLGDSYIKRKYYEDLMLECTNKAMQVVRESNQTQLENNL